jgi:EAL domain-containing protein (putative c-di-GMP-specific phosphodiesterase class I)
MGCHEGQGYHIAQPMEREALQAWLLREAVAQAGAAHAVAA